MSNTPPRRGDQRPAPGGARRPAQPAAQPPAQAAPRPKAKASQLPPSRRPARPDADYDQYEADDQYEPEPVPSRSARQAPRNAPQDRRPRSGNAAQDRYDRYPPDNRSYRPSNQRGRGGPPPRGQSYRPRYVAPQRDVFPIIMGSLVGALVVGLLIVVYLLVSHSSSNSPTVPNTAASNGTAGQSTPLAMAQSTVSTGNTAAQLTMIAGRPANGLGTPMPDEGNQHVADGEAITYNNYPPSSGTHYAEPATAGFYTSTLAEGHFVHSMEHGYVVLYYQPSVSDAIKQELKGLMTSLPLSKYGTVKMVIVPYTQGMTTPLAIAAWDRLMKLSDYNFDEIKAFYQQYVDHGPEDIP